MDIPFPRGRVPRFGVVVAALLVGSAACTQSVAPTPQSQEVAGSQVSQVAAAQAQEAPNQKQGQTEAAAIAKSQVLTLTPKKAVVGQDVQATAAALPPGKTVDLVWQTVEGGWVVEGYYRFRGKQYSEVSWPLGQATVGTDGRLSARFKVPEDYGGMHSVVVSADGVDLAQGGLDVPQTFELSPKEGPIGTLIELRAQGLGWRTMESTWVVNWDNHNAGWVSAAGTRGSAVARFRATGPAGDHLIKVYTGWQGQAYLNHEQAPNAYLPRPDFVFRVTPGGQVPAAYVEPYQPQPVPPAESVIGAGLDLSPTQGPVATRAALKGSGFPAGSDLSLAWETWMGSRVTDEGYAPKEKALGKVTVSTEGRIDLPMTIPDDLGGLHALVLKDGDKELARTYFVIETSIVGISPSSGPVGTPVSIHLKGVGWTEYDNIYVMNYDNAYTGYACGFNSQGDVVVNFTASGAPGVHLIDLYPGIYQGPEKGQQLYRMPQLTYVDDHPGNKIPALRFAFTVTE